MILTGVHNDLKNGRQQCATGMAIRLALVLFWGLGILEAVLWGFHPDKATVITGVFTYPVAPVFFLCGYITAQAVVLYAVLRPFGLGSHFRRVLAALPIFCFFCYADYFILGIGRSVMPDYGDPFENALFLWTIATGLAVAVWHFWQSRSKGGIQM